MKTLTNPLCSCLILYCTVLHLFSARNPDTVPDVTRGIGHKSINTLISRNLLLRQSINLFQIRCPNQPLNFYHKSCIELNTRIQLPDTLPYFFKNCCTNIQPYLILRTGGEVDLNICLLLVIRIRHWDTLTSPSGALELNICLLSITRIQLPDILPYLNICLLSITRVRLPDTLSYLNICSVHRQNV